MSPLEDSGLSALTIFLIPSIPSPQALVLPCFLHREEVAWEVGMEVEVAAVVLLEVDSEGEAVEAGKRGELKNLFRPFYNSPDGKSGLFLYPHPQIEELLSAL